MTDRTFPEIERAASLAEDLIQAAVDYERSEGIYAKGCRQELSEARAAVEAAILGHAQTPAGNALAVEVDGCFQAAYCEGLSERLAEADQSPGTLADLIYRRLIPAHQAACVVLADEALSDTSTLGNSK